MTRALATVISQSALFVPNISQMNFYLCVLEQPFRRVVYIIVDWFKYIGFSLPFRDLINFQKVNDTTN